MATQIGGALGVSLWQCQATVLWAPEGDVPGDVRHFVWLHPPVPTALVGRNRWCRLPPRKCAAAAAFCLHAHLSRSRWHTDCRSLASEPGNARQLFYGLPKATCQATCQVTSGILVGCTPPFRPLLWAEVDGVACHHAHLSRQPWDRATRTHEPPPRGLLAFLSLGSEPLAMPGNCFMGSQKATCQATSGILVGCTPPVPTALVGRNRWCRLPPRKCAAAAAFCLHAHLSRSRWHTDCRSLGSEPLAMPGNCFMGSRRRRSRRRQQAARGSAHQGEALTISCDLARL